MWFKRVGLGLGTLLRGRYYWGDRSFCGHEKSKERVKKNGTMVIRTKRD